MINAFLDKPQWRIQTVNSDPSKPACKALQKKGVEVVKGDLNDVDSLIAAFQVD